jgi:transposase
VFTLVSEGCKVDICVMNNTQENIKMPFNEESFLRLQGMYLVVRDENVQLAADVLYYKNEIAQLKRMIFGAKSERFISGEDSSQLLLGLNLTEPMAEPVKTETITYERKQKEENKQLIHSRQPLPSHLPRHEIVIEPMAKPAGAKKIGEEITEILEYTPGALIVNRIVRPKYLLPKEDNKDTRIIIADLPTLPIPKGIAGPGLLTHIIISKYVDHLPIYRQAQQFKRQGVEIAESTIVDWIHQCCDLLAPLYETLKESTLKCKYLQADETPIPVLTKDKPGATHKGYL